MSDDTQRVATADLKLVLRNTEKSARDAQAALEATERLVASVGPRFDALEARLDTIPGATERSRSEVVARTRGDRKRRGAAA